MTTQFEANPSNAPVFERIEPRLLLTGEQVCVDYLVIAGNDFFSGGQACAAIQELADWKDMKGFRTRIASMSEVSAANEGVGDYIRHGLFEEGGAWWSTPPKYVLLVGDSSQVPAARGFCLTHEEDEHVSDNPYADILLYNGEPGSDNLPDLAIGRIPVTTVADAATVINKILDYDRTPYLPQSEAANWYKNALVASYFEDGALAIEGDPDGKEDFYYFMETAHRVADFLGQDFDYWTDARGSWQSFALAA